MSLNPKPLMSLFWGLIGPFGVRDLNGMGFGRLLFRASGHVIPF